ncbi:MAG TPA: 1-deoxy-D-xylulose-5-phosphate reductoisomerase [Thermomicrobiales bacterium]|nr:1-deoxy-D-xylulose-5-phosphate reductoisomerase [Thermomicrobiales bacterium]
MTTWAPNARPRQSPIQSRGQNTPGSRMGVAVLGSTGSVGTQTLDVIAEMPDRFSVVALAASKVSPLLEEQSRRHRPDLVAVSDGAKPWAGDGQLVKGNDALLAAALHPAADIVVVATSGHAAMTPTFRAVEAGKTIALANKETIVCAGELLMPLAQACGVSIRPVDSEHSAIWQCLVGVPEGSVDRLILTASGGPFRQTTAADLARVTVAQTMSHPTWSMGGKITVDSASLMNKGLEVIEARWLFGVPLDRIDVVVHPESIVHSLVELVDGSVLAQLGLPDMRLPIQYALTFPERLPSPRPRLSLTETSTLHFERPDLERFHALRLAREAGEAGGTYPTVLSAADDVAVDAFLAGRLRFVDIPDVVSDVLAAHLAVGPLTLEAIAEADAWSRIEAERTIARRQ